jgi:hypothetical protein
MITFYIRLSEWLSIVAAKTNNVTAGSVHMVCTVTKLETAVMCCFNHKHCCNTTMHCSSNTHDQSIHLTAAPSSNTFKYISVKHCYCKATAVRLCILALHFILLITILNQSATAKSICDIVYIVLSHTPACMQAKNALAAVVKTWQL